MTAVSASSTGRHKIGVLCCGAGFQAEDLRLEADVRFCPKCPLSGQSSRSAFASACKEQQLWNDNAKPLDVNKYIN